MHERCHCKHLRGKHVVGHGRSNVEIWDASNTDVAASRSPHVNDEVNGGQKRVGAAGAARQPPNQRHSKLPNHKVLDSANRFVRRTAPDSAAPGHAVASRRNSVTVQKRRQRITIGASAGSDYF